VAPPWCLRSNRIQISSGFWELNITNFHKLNSSISLLIWLGPSFINPHALTYCSTSGDFYHFFSSNFCHPTFLIQQEIWLNNKMLETINYFGPYFHMEDIYLYVSTCKQRIKEDWWHNCAFRLLWLPPLKYVIYFV
jgi:hypothetical protein